MGYVVSVQNMATQESINVIMEKRLIEEQDTVGIEQFLQDKIELAKSDVSLYIQISEKMMAKKAKQL